MKTPVRLKRCSASNEFKTWLLVAHYLYNNCIKEIGGGAKRRAREDLADIVSVHDYMTNLILY